MSPTTTDDRYNHFISDKVNDYPHGYPRLAAFISSDPEGHIYRSFGYLRSRLLLYYQDEISQLEDELSKLDKSDEQSDPIRLNSRRYDENHSTPPSSRKELIHKLDSRLEHYDNLLLRARQILSLPPTPRNLHRQYFNWIYNEKPLVKSEYEFIYHENDFVSLGTADGGWVGPFIKDFGRMMPVWLMKVVLGAQKDESSTSDEVLVFSDSRTQKYVKAVIGMTAALMLLIPVIVFYILAIYDVSYGGRIGALCGFLVLFNAALLTMTDISKQELFGASAGYAM